MKQFKFTVYELVPGTRCTFFPTEVTKEAPTFTEALEKLTESHPGHYVAEHTRGLWTEEVA